MYTLNCNEKVFLRKGIPVLLDDSNSSDSERTEISCSLYASLELTGVEEDHGLQTDVLLPLKLQLTKPRGGCQQHVENLHDALHTLSLLPAQTERERGSNRQHGKEDNQKEGYQEQEGETDGDKEEKKHRDKNRE